MIEKFDLTKLICMGGNMGPEDLEESWRLRMLISEDPKKLEYRFEQARFFASKDDDIHTIIAYCDIIKVFENNLIAYEELATYLYHTGSNDWSAIVCMEGLNYYNSKKLKEILELATKDLINIYDRKI